MFSRNSIFPAILTYTTIILTSLLFFYRRQINLDKVIAPALSFLFISSGFAVQILISEHDELKCFFEEWGKVFSSPPVTVLATASGIFIGNTLLKLFSVETDRKGISVLFMNGLEAHIRSLSIINFYFSSKNIDIASHQIYLTKIKDNKSYDKALVAVGNFRDNEIDMLSKYESHLWTTLVDIEKTLNGSIIPICHSQLKITATIVYAMLCSCTLAQKHLPTQEKEQKQSFLRDFDMATQWLFDKPIECPSSVRKGFIEVFIDVKKRYQELYKINESKKASVLLVVYLSLGKSSCGNELELMVFCNSIDEIRDKVKKCLRSYAHKTEVEMDRMIEHTQFEILSPWN